MHQSGQYSGRFGEATLTAVQEASYDYIGVTNILTDIVLVILPVPMMWKIKISGYKKVLVLALFAVRLVFVIFFPTRQV